MNKNINCYVRGNLITLDESNYITHGGEGRIHGIGDIIYKIWLDPKNSIPTAKVKELQTIPDKHIIVPQHPVSKDKSGKNHIGWTMQWVKTAKPLVQLYTRAFKTRYGIDQQMVIKIVKSFQKLLETVHKQKILAVDIKGENWLCTDNKWDELWGIDTACYQTPSFPATAYTPLTRDWLSKDFNELSDWFSWGIVVFQILTGVGPYQGSHPEFDSLPKKDATLARMKKHISVFNPRATWSRAAEPFDVIPSALRSWFKAVFEDGLREKPPQDYEIVVIITASTTIESGSKLLVKWQVTYEGTILDCFWIEGLRVVLTKKHTYLNKSKYLPLPIDSEIAFTEKGKPVGAYLENGIVQLIDIERNERITDISLQASGLTSSGGALYAICDRDVVQICFHDLPNKILSSIRSIGNVLNVPNATHFGKGVLIQNMLGAFYVSIFPDSGQCIQIPIPELNNYFQVIEAKYENRVLVVIARSKSGYDRLVIRFQNSYNLYDVRTVENINFSKINFAVNSKGVVCLLNEDHNLEVFHHNPGQKTTVIQDDILEEEILIFAEAEKILFVKNNMIYQASLK